MGLFNFFKKSMILEDAYWGRLIHVSSRKAADEYFEGKIFFSPGNNEVGLHISAEASGPTEQQKEFYQNIEANFNNYIEQITPLIVDEFRNWKDDFIIKDFLSEFTLVWLSIPRLEVKPLSWEMSFTTIHDENHHITIDFKDDTPTGILIDG